MEDYIQKCRNDIIAQDGNVQAAKGDKIFIKSLIDVKQDESDSNFFTWVKAKIDIVKGYAVGISEVVLIGKFQNEEKQAVIDANIETLRNRFRGNKTITLLKDDHWLIVPGGKHSGISDIKFQEEISNQLGFEGDNIQSI